MNHPNIRVHGISVLVRSMDRQTLTRALDSIASQTFKPSEIVVIAACGHNHGKLPDLWKTVPLRLILPQRKLDRAEAANAAIDAAAGNWINFLDDDDELLPDHLDKLANALQPLSQVRLAFSRTEVVREDGSDAGFFGWKHHGLELLERSKFHLMAALFHRSLIDEGARFDESLPIHEDQDFWIQCAQRTRFEFVDHITNRWHAFIGTSGAGGGSNLNGALVEEVSITVRNKWAALHHEWSNTLDGLLFLGMRALKTGHSIEALQLLERAIVLGPDNVNALNLGGMANLHSGNLQRAKVLLLRALFIVPGHSGIQQNLLLLERKLNGSD